MAHSYRYEVLADLLIRHAELVTKATTAALEYQPRAIKRLAYAGHEDRRIERKGARVIRFPERGV